MCATVAAKFPVADKYRQGACDLKQTTRALKCTDSRGTDSTSQSTGAKREVKWLIMAGQAQTTLRTPACLLCSATATSS